MVLRRFKCDHIFYKCSHVASSTLFSHTQEYQRLFELEPEDFGPMVQCEKEANARHQLWKSMLDFMEKSSAWTEDPILGDNGEVQLSIESIRSEVGL